jgi:5'(3')-deoxyribonucleotidase
MKLKIYIDLDNTVNDLTKHWISFLDGVDLEPSQIDIERGMENYDFKKYFTDDVKNSKKDKVISSILSKDYFWKTLPVKPHAIRVIERMYNDPRFDLYIATALWTSNENNQRNKEQWIKHNLPFFDLKKVYYTAEKHKLDGNVMIDDKPENIELWPGEFTIMFSYPYNKGVEADVVVKSWTQVESIFY